MSNIYDKNHFVWKLSFWQSDRQTWPTDCSTRVTKWSV